MKFTILAIFFGLIPIIPLLGLQTNEEQDYRIYHQQIIEVEKLISDEKFEEAFNLLEQVFNSYNFVFVKDYKIAAQLALYLENQGYPGERLIGNDFWMSTIISHHNSISKSYAQKDTLYRFIKPMLYQAIKKGQISPYEYAIIDDWQKAVSSDRTEPGYGFLNPPNQSTLSKTNQLRQKIVLRNIELRNKLVDVEYSTGMSFYLPDWVEGKIKVEQK